MLLTIHDANLQKVAFVDNEKQGTLNYYDDTWTRSLETGSSTFEFTVFKKAIKSDTTKKKAYNQLNEKAFVSFKYHGKSYVFSVMSIEENEKTIKCYCENLNLELINEYANPYKADRAMSFKEYCEVMDLLNYTHLSIGINEISDQKRTLEWEGQDTKLARLLSLATRFDAEIDFDTKLNADSSIKSFKVNVYREYDENHQGVGRIRDDIQLTYGKNLKSIKRTIDKTGVFNSIRPTGKRRVKNGSGEEVEEVVTIQGLDEWKKYNSEGICEFYQLGAHLVAPLSMQMYPSTFTNSTGELDQYIRKDFSYDTDNPNELRRLAYNELKKHCYPAITYDVDGFVDVEIGDTVKINDDGFNPTLMVRARVLEQKISFTNPNRNKTTFANFKALKNNLSKDIQAAFERLFEAAKPYTIKLSTDNGVIFKNQIGQSLVTPTLYKGGKPVVAGVTWRWALDGEVTTGMTYLVRGSNVTDTVTLTVAAYIGNKEVAVDEISLVNVVDGKLGTPGTPGRDGRTQYTHIAYSNSADGTKDFSVSASNRAYIGMYVDFNSADSNTPSDYNWTLVKGSDGANGVAGKAGADGRTPYLHIAYATSNNGSQGFSTTDSTNKTYIGTYTDYTQADSTDYRVYKWALIKGADGTGISNVTNYYLATTVSTGITRASAGWTTTPQPITSDKRYLWNYRVELYTNGTSKTTEPTVIGVHGEKGERGLQGEQGIPGIRGTDGRTQYTHIAYADNAVGGGFSQTNTNKPYIGMYVDFNAADSNNPTVYKWTKWKGEDGAQGVPGAKGADGRTPYFHRAWSNSADGRDGFSTIDSTNKRYLGTLTDFNEVNSQDPTAYKWTALFDNVQVGARNFALGTSTPTIGTQGKIYTLAQSTYKWLPIQPLYLTFDYLASETIKGFRVNRVIKYRNGSPEQWDFTTDDKTLGKQYIDTTSVKSGTYSQPWQWKPYSNGRTSNLIEEIALYLNFENGSDGTVVISNLRVNTGTVSIDWIPAPEDIEGSLNSKADQSLTQQQLNALNEKSQILEAEMKAKASMEAFSELEKAYNAFVKLNAEGQKKSESDLVEAGRRIDLLTTQFGGLAELKTFIDTYMKSTNEGLIIGKNDASSTIKVSSDRISMFSAGKEVMYISQGVINIDNGIFTASVQIGRFRTEQYYLNKDVNVIRYIGG